jgi:hypothetical protein
MLCIRVYALAQHNTSHTSSNEPLFIAIDPINTYFEHLVGWGFVFSTKSNNNLIVFEDLLQKKMSGNLENDSTSYY